jgi:hypothetical protein
MEGFGFFILIFAASWLVAASTDLPPGDMARGFTAFRTVDPVDGKPPLVPAAAISFRIVGDRIVSNAGGVISEDEGCVMFDVRNWSCTFDDGSGGKAMQDGTFVFWPSDSMVGVSQFQWHVLQCQWGLRTGPLQPAVNWLFGPFFT